MKKRHDNKKYKYFIPFTSSLKVILGPTNSLKI